MIYSNTSELIELLKRENLWAKKRLGQNFLVNPEALKKIVQAAEITHEDHILEIGPGLGILTEQLAAHAGKVTSIELDQEIIPILKKNLGNTQNVEIIHKDALKTSLPTHRYKLVANIPYYITSPILSHFLQPQSANEQRPEILVLLMQKEVAQKICVQDGDHTILSLEVQAFGKPSIVCHVGKGSFFPQPKVDSAVLKITSFEKPKISDPKTFFTMIKGAFSQKRKKISNTLPHSLSLTNDEADELFKSANISPDERPQNISLEGWENLVQAYKKISG